MVKLLSVSATAPRSNDELITSLNSDSKYYKIGFVLEYDTENDDREYISGVRLFENSKIEDVNFYYPGAKNQSAKIWELVAKKKGVPAHGEGGLSRRQFMAYLNSGISMKIKAEKIDFKGKTTMKNLPVEIVD